MSNTSANAAQTSPNQAATHASALAANLAAVANAKKVEKVVYKCNILTMRYVFKAGKVANFLTKDGVTSQYATDIDIEIEELDAEIKSGHPNIISRGKEAVPVTDTMEALKQKHIQEYLAAQAKATQKTNDAGSTEPEKLKMATSATVAEASAGSDSMNAGTPAQATPAAKVSINVPKSA